MAEDYEERLDSLKEEKNLSYERFEEHGDHFIDVMTSGVSRTDEVWVSADEILEASNKNKASFQEKSGNRIFTSIYNLLCDAEVLPAFHDSPPYDIRVSGYREDDIIDAWEYVSGGEYDQGKERGKEREIEEKTPEEVDSLYDELKD